MKRPIMCDESTQDPRLPPLIVLLGPTAVGKTALSLGLCEQFSGEIISADSRQIYRMMDIGTAKATPEEQAQRASPPNRHSSPRRTAHIGRIPATRLSDHR